MRNSVFVAAFLLVAFICHSQSKEYSLQNVDARNKVSLNGLWQIIIDPLENGLYNHSLEERKNGYFKNEKMNQPDDLIEYDFDQSYQLEVPGDWNTQMEKLYYYEGTVWYKRSFSYKRKTGVRTALNFEGVNYQCKVYLNGTYLGDHVGGYTSFGFDVTDQLQDENFLILKVDNKRLRDGVPTVNFDWWNYGGITRTVSLIELSETFINDYSFSLDQENANKVVGWVSLDGAKRGKQQVTVSIPKLGKSISVKTNNEGKASFSFLVPKLQKWSPSDPIRYEISIQFGEDIIEDQIGFKTISTDGSKILLNGEYLFLKGISIHEEAPFGAGRVVSVDQAKILLGWAKELGCNYVRLAHYPHSEFMVKLAEEMGFLIWSEIPVYWTIDYDNPETYKNAEKQLTDMINRDKNRVAIGLWSVANETPITAERLAFLKSLIDTARKIDPTRLITAALNTQRGKDNEIVIDDPLGNYIDVIGINTYCGWYSKKPQECVDITWANPSDKPVIFSELGAGALQGLHGDVNERWTEEYQSEVYRCNIEMMKKVDFLAGVSPWILKDFLSPRRNLRHIQNDFNRKGLISDTGQKKEAFYILQKFYSETNKPAENEKVRP
ncbi:MAG: beta-glucuronidase [Cyclobacteriaceae bacterium]|jgi:beta-glucuronidase